MLHSHNQESSTWNPHLITPSGTGCYREDFSQLENKWIAIEGIDAVGKSTQIAAIQKLCQRFEVVTATIPEFSSSPVGRTLQHIVQERRFYSLDPEQGTPISDLITIFGDLVYSLEILAPSAGKTVLLSDRGLLSIVAYQAQRLSEKSRLPVEEAIGAIKSLADLVLSQLRTPDLNVVLTLPIEMIGKRLQHRGEPPLSKVQRDFLIKTQDLFVHVSEEFPTVVIDVSDLSIEEVTQEILAKSITYLTKNKL